MHLSALLSYTCTCISAKENHILRRTQEKFTEKHKVQQSAFYTYTCKYLKIPVFKINNLTMHKEKLLNLYLIFNTCTTLKIQNTFCIYFVLTYQMLSFSEFRKVLFLCFCHGLPLPLHSSIFISRSKSKWHINYCEFILNSPWPRSSPGNVSFLF